jgi:hypothetical protein
VKNRKLGLEVSALGLGCLSFSDYYKPLMLLALRRHGTSSIMLKL